MKIKDHIKAYDLYFFIILALCFIIAGLLFYISIVDHQENYSKYIDTIYTKDNKEYNISGTCSIIETDKYIEIKSDESTIILPWENISMIKGD